MKVKRENNDDGPDNKRNRRTSEDQVRLLIPSTIAGAVIGKGGQHIQRMRTQYKATVTVDDSQGPERTILIATDLDATLQIISEMLKYFEERDDEYDVRLLIHQSLAGCVIGKGGQKIKEIRDKIGCRILKVFSNVAPQSTDRVVQTVGKQNQVVDAVREVIMLTRETPIKGPMHNYDPVNFDRMFSDEYGGYGGGGGGGSGGGNQRPSRGNQRGFGSGGGGGGGNGGGGGGGDRNRNDRSRSGGRRENPFINPWANDDRFGGNNVGGGGGGGGGGFDGNFGGGFGGGGNFPNNAGGFNNGPNGNNFGNPVGNVGGGFGPGNQGGFGGNAGGFGNALNNQGNLGGGGGGGGGGVGGGLGGGNNAGNVGFGGGNQGGPVGNAGGGFGGGMNNQGNGSGFGGPNNLGNGANVNAGSGFTPGPNNGNAPGNLPNGHDPKNSTQVTIPKDLAGAIIGKGGGRIRRIRNDSGAYITIDEPLPGSTDRIITISGNPKQIQMAQYLLQQSVHENNGRRNF